MVEDVDGNTFLDFAAGHCGLLDRPLPSKSRRGHSEASRGTDSHVRHGFLLREHAVACASGLARPFLAPKRRKFSSPIPARKRWKARIKLARYATQRDKMIAFYGCFHGRTMGSLSLTASKSTQRKGFGALLSGVEHIPYPYAYRCAYGHTPETCGAEILETLEESNFQASLRSRRSGRDYHRADSGRRRLRSRAEVLPAGIAARSAASTASC